MEPFSKKVLTNNRSKVFFLPALALLLFLLFIPSYSLSQSGHEHHSDKSSQLGSEYQVKEMPMEHHHHDDGGGDPFRTRGSHKDLGLKNLKLCKQKVYLLEGAISIFTCVSSAMGRMVMAVVPQPTICILGPEIFEKAFLNSDLRRRILSLEMRIYIEQS